MLPELIIPTSSILVIGFIIYVYMMNKTKVNLSLIEKGLDSNIINSKYDYSIIYHLGTILVGSGFGIFVGQFLVIKLHFINEVTYTGSVILFSGLGILIGFYLKKYFIKN